MRNGHYTAGDIDGLTVETDKNGKPQMAYGRVNSVRVWSNGFDIEIGELGQKKNYNRVENVPVEYKVVADLLRKKASPHGGHRIGAGRKETTGTKKTRSFRLDEYEYMKVKQYIEQLRKK